ncbi:unnamed protein product, partial [Mesorhabditis spiculigera]
MPYQGKTKASSVGADTPAVLKGEQHGEGKNSTNNQDNTKYTFPNYHQQPTPHMQNISDHTRGHLKQKRDASVDKKWVNKK